MSLLTTREAARRLGRSVDFVRDLCASGQLETRKVNGRWYVYSASVERFLTPPAPVPVASFPMQVQIRGRRVR